MEALSQLTLPRERPRAKLSAVVHRPRAFWTNPELFISSSDKHRRSSGSCLPTRCRSNAFSEPKSKPQAPHSFMRGSYQVAR